MAEAQAQQPAIPAEITEQLSALAEVGYNHFKAGVTPEQKAATKEQGRKWKEDPEFAASKMAQVTESFATADKDGDGLLTKEEYLALMTIFQA